MSGALLDHCGKALNAIPLVLLVLDRKAVTTTATALGSDYVVVRLKLGAGNNGAHTLVADNPVSLQVEGYGFATSYQYPGGLNLKGISPALPPIQ